MSDNEKTTAATRHLPQTEAEAEDAALADLLAAVGSGVVRAALRAQASWDAEERQREDDAKVQAALSDHEQNEAETDAKALLRAAHALRCAAEPLWAAGKRDDAQDAQAAADDADVAAVVVLRRVHGEAAEEEAASLETEIRNEEGAR